MSVLISLVANSLIIIVLLVLMNFIAFKVFGSGTSSISSLPSPTILSYAFSAIAYLTLEAHFSFQASGSPTFGLIVIIIIPVIASILFTLRKSGRDGALLARNGAIFFIVLSLMGILVLTRALVAYLMFGWWEVISLTITLVYIAFRLLSSRTKRSPILGIVVLTIFYLIILAIHIFAAYNSSLLSASIGILIFTSILVSFSEIGLSYFYSTAMLYHRVVIAVEFLLSAVIIIAFYTFPGF